MKVVTARFVKSALHPADFPRDGRPEIVFAGRSNVGKSSLLNQLLGRKGLAKTSKTPGKTRTINFFVANDRVFFVDLPGYGFARAPKGLRETWGTMITSYLKGRATLRLAVHLIDSRHPPTKNDHELLALLDEAEVPTLLVATKCDKLNQSQRATFLAAIRRDLELDDDALVLPVSNLTGEGVKELWSVLDERLDGP